MSGLRVLQVLSCSHTPVCLLLSCQLQMQLCLLCLNLAASCNTQDSIQSPSYLSLRWAQVDAPQSSGFAPQDSAVHKMVMNVGNRPTINQVSGPFSLIEYGSLYRLKFLIVHCSFFCFTRGTRTPAWRCTRCTSLRETFMARCVLCACFMCVHIAVSAAVDGLMNDALHNGTAASFQRSLHFA